MNMPLKPLLISLTAFALVFAALPAGAAAPEQACPAGAVDCVTPVEPAITEASSEITTAEPISAIQEPPRKKLTARERSPHFFASKSYNRWYAKMYIKRAYGWDTYNWKCLDRLWQLESGWNELAKNRRSGAYGIPQALPGNKMAAMGRNWKKNPEVQIKWGSSYIKSRYKSPCKALAFMERRGWY